LRDPFTWTMLTMKEDLSLQKRLSVNCLIDSTGKKPGKNKQEKRMLQYQSELKRKQKVTTSSLLSTSQAMLTEQEKSGSAHIIISGGSGVYGGTASAIVEPKKVHLSKKRKGTESSSGLSTEKRERTAVGEVEPYNQEGLKQGQFQEFKIAAATKGKKQKTT